MTRSPDEAVLGLWRTLSARDWDLLPDYLTDDCVYVDMPVGPTLAARGPGDVVKRLQVGLAALWKDYWDFGTVVDAAPADWLERLGEADTSWVYDATGEI